MVVMGKEGSMGSERMGLNEEGGKQRESSLLLCVFTNSQSKWN